MSVDDLNIQPKLIRLLANPDFDSSKFVKDIYQSGDENDLIEAKIRVQNLYDETAQQLKKNVYKNNSIFIDTARDVSYLESEMYQLNHLLNDQKNVINYLETLSILNTKYTAPKSDKDKDSVDSSKKLFSSLIEDIEANNSILIYKDQNIWFQGELLQIEETQAGKCIPVQKCHCFVLDDVFIMCTLSTSSVPHTQPRRSLLYNAFDTSNKSTTYDGQTTSMDSRPLPIGSGNHVLKFQHCYPLTSLAVINVKDDQSARQTDAVSGLIKFLMFPETLILKAPDDKSKREWLQAVDLAKKALIKGTKPKDDESSSDDKGSTIGTAEPKCIMRAPRPNDLVDGARGRDVNTLEDWLLDFPDELDMFIAQRQFDDAVDLIEKVKPILAYHQANTTSVSSNLPIIQELSVQLNQLADRLVDTLYSEITGFDDADDNLNIISGRGGTFGFSVPASGNSGAGVTGSNTFFGNASNSPPSSTNLSTSRYRPPRTLVARAVLLLIRLGKANQARTLYLANRSALIRHRLADLKLEGNLALYIEKLGNVFFGIVAETRDEIDLFFNQPPAPVPPPRASKSAATTTAVLKPKEKNKDDQIDASASLASFTVWLSKYELKNFAGYVLRQIEGIRTNFSLVVRCLAVSRSQCLMLSDAIINLDIIYAFDTLTNAAVAKMTEEQGEKMGEASRAKICDDDWTPQSFGSREGLEKCLSELRELGLPPLETVTLPYSVRASKLSSDKISLPNAAGSKEITTTKYELVDFEACKLRLARSSTTFLKIYLNFVRDLGHIYTPERYKIFREVLLHTFLNHLQYLTVYLKSPKFRNSPELYELIHANARFMLRCLVPVLNELWAETVGYRDDFKTLDVTVEDILEINKNTSSDISPSTPTTDKNINSKPVQFL